MSRQPPPPPLDPNEPTLVEPPARRVVTEEATLPPPQRIVRPYPWWLWVVTALALAAAAVFLVLWLTQRNTGHDVPSLVGLRQSEAQDRASSHGFTLKVVHAQVPGQAGVVSDQAPQTGASLEDGATMMAVIPLGRQQIIVPSLVGLTYARAEQLAQPLGLQLTRATVVSTKPSGTIVSQDPKPGQRIPRGSSVGVSVSSGTGRLTVPALVGSNQADAVKKIVDAGLAPVVVNVSSQQPQGTVVAQNPAPNQKVARGAKVRINVSGGTPTTSTQTQTVTTTQTTTTTATTTVSTTTP